MVNQKLTREQLIIELARIEDSHNRCAASDERRRNEFAKAFNWYEDRGLYPSQNILKTPSWEEIFVQVGKLLVLEELKQKIVPIPFDSKPYG